MNTNRTSLHPRSSQQGLNLIELMVAMAISMVLLLGITSLIVSQNDSRNELEKASRQIENGRYAMQLLGTDLRQAGYYGLYYQLQMHLYPKILGNGANPPPDPCDVATTDMRDSLYLPIQGYNDALPAAAIFTCKLDGVSTANNVKNYVPGTDILVVRRTDTGANPVTFTSAVSGANSTTTTALDSGQVYLQTIGNDFRLQIGAGVTEDTTS